MTSVWFVSPLKNNIALRIESDLCPLVCLILWVYVFLICSELFVLWIINL